MQPKMTTSAVVRQSELRGKPKVGWTLAKTLDIGSPPSRAKAQVMRLLVVMILIVAKRRHTRGNLEGMSD